MQTGSAQIRRFRESDREALYDICVRTAAAGSDARGLWRSDDLMPDLSVAPYLQLAPHLAPQFASDLEDDGRVVGHARGVADTPAFVANYRRACVLGITP